MTCRATPTAPAGPLALLAVALVGLLTRRRRYDRSA
ncbi:MAG: MYXO-CTERM sorting domain-containing protein [Sandaracinaceae bacterium]